MLLKYDLCSYYQSSDEIPFKTRPPKLSKLQGTLLEAVYYSMDHG
jgi:hypothetical protein